MTSVRCSKKRAIPGKPAATPWQCGNSGPIDEMFVERSVLTEIAFADLPEHVKCPGCISEDVVPFGDAVALVMMRGNKSAPKVEVKPEPAAEQIAPVVLPEPAPVEIKAEPVVTPPVVVAPTKPAVAKKADRVIGDAERGLLNAIAAKGGDELAKAYHAAAEAMIGSHDTNVIFNCALKAWKKASKAVRYGKAIPASEILAAFPIELPEAAPAPTNASVVAQPAVVVEVAAPVATIDSDEILVESKKPKEHAADRLKREARERDERNRVAREAQKARERLLNPTTVEVQRPPAPRPAAKKPVVKTAPHVRAPNAPVFAKVAKKAEPKPTETPVVEAEVAPVVEAVSQVEVVAVTPAPAAQPTPKSAKTIAREAAEAKRRDDEAKRLAEEVLLAPKRELKQLAKAGGIAAEAYEAAKAIGSIEAFVLGLEWVKAALKIEDEKAKAVAKAMAELKAHEEAVAAKAKAKAEADAKAEAKARAEAEAKALRDAEDARILAELEREQAIANEKFEREFAALLAEEQDDDTDEVEFVAKVPDESQQAIVSSK